MNRKAQIFTISAIVLLSFLFVSLEVYSYAQEQRAIKSRVETMNRFVRSIESNLERQLFISGYRILFLAQTEVTLRGKYVSDFGGGINSFEDFFEEALFNDSFSDSLVNEYANNFLMGVRLSDLNDSINEISKKINVDVNLNNSVISISQVDPWHVKFVLTSDFSMTDRRGLARWDKRQEIVSFVPIIGLEDSLFIVSSGSRISRKINRTIFEGFYADDSDITNLSLHYANGYYAENPNAPSFLNRLNGVFSSDVNGIESFVNTKDFPSEYLAVKIKSKVDYIYFDDDSNIAWKRVYGMPNDFLIDDFDGRFSKYNVSGIVY